MNRLLVVLGSSCALVLAGCDKEDAALARSTATEELTSVEFNPKSGLLIPPATASFIDVKTEDVGEALISGEIELSGQVYRSSSASHDKTLASITLKQDVAERIKQAGTGHLAGTGQTFRVLRMEQSITSADDRELLISIDDPNRTLSSGEFITARFTIGSANPVTVVPREALLQTTGAISFMPSTDSASCSRRSSWALRAKSRWRLWMAFMPATKSSCIPS